MAEPTLNRTRPEPEYGRALLQIHAVALEGLNQANGELTKADDTQDPEAWALWRGYRRAMLEVLAVTDKLSLPPDRSGLQTGKDVPEQTGFHESKTA